MLPVHFFNSFTTLFYQPGCDTSELGPTCEYKPRIERKIMLKKKTYFQYFSPKQNYSTVRSV